MARFIRKMDEVRGLPPGSLVFVGSRKMERPSIRMMNYDAETVRDEEVRDVESLRPLLAGGGTTWINMDGLHDPELVRRLGEMTGMTPLVMEDVLNTGQRPKLDELEDSVFATLKMLTFNKEEDIVEAEQLSLFLTPNAVLTFQERPGDAFDAVRERIRRQHGRFRRLGPDYLAYSLLDAVVEGYTHLIEQLGERIEDMQDDVLEAPDPELLEEISICKRELSFVRRFVRPVREFLFRLARLESDVLQEATRPYFRDLHDLIVQAAEALESYNEMLSDMLNIYNSVVSNKLNEIMKFLTIFSTIFIPLTFLAGIYGTNFEFLPEIHFKYGYPLFWGVLVLVALGMLRYFRRRGWF